MPNPGSSASNPSTVWGFGAYIPTPLRHCERLDCTVAACSESAGIVRCIPATHPSTMLECKPTPESLQTRIQPPNPHPTREDSAGSAPGRREQQDPPSHLCKRSSALFPAVRPPWVVQARALCQHPVRNRCRARPPARCKSSGRWAASSSRRARASPSPCRVTSAPAAAAAAAPAHKDGAMRPGARGARGAGGAGGARRGSAPRHASAALRP